MKDIRKPEFMKGIPSKGHFPLVEVWIALAVYFVGSLIGSFVQMPALVLYLLGNREYQDMIFTGRVSMDKMMDIIANVPQWMNIVLLVGELGLLLAVFLYCRLLEKRKLSTLGFQKKGCVLQYVKGLALGLLLFGMTYLLCYVSGSLTVGGVSLSGETVLYVVGFFAGYLIQGMAEEVLCRGYFLVSLSRRCSVTLSVVLSSLFFSALHGMNQGVTLLALINIFLFGVFLALLFIRFENIWIVGALHSIWNFAQGNLFGIQVSGMQLQPSLIKSDVKEGWEIINGGSFGMEGGLAVTVVLAAALGILGYSMKKHGFFVEAVPENQSIPSHQGNLFQEGGNIPEREGENQGKTEEKAYQNMGLNPQETPWRPGEEKQPEDKSSATGFDQTYFRD